MQFFFRGSYVPSLRDNVTGFQKHIFLLQGTLVAGGLDDLGNVGRTVAVRAMSTSRSRSRSGILGQAQVGTGTVLTEVRCQQHVQRNVWNVDNHQMVHDVDVQVAGKLMR